MHGDGLLGVLEVKVKERVTVLLVVQGLGTKDKVLIRILALNNSFPRLSALKAVYPTLFKESLIDAVSGDTSGWYRQTFLGILQRDQ